MPGIDKTEHGYSRVQYRCSSCAGPAASTTSGSPTPPAGCASRGSTTASGRAEHRAASTGETCGRRRRVRRDLVEKDALAGVIYPVTACTTCR